MSVTALAVAQAPAPCEKLQGAGHPKLIFLLRASAGVISKPRDGEDCTNRRDTDKHARTNWFHRNSPAL